MKGRRDPVDRSQSKEEAPRRTETRLRDGVEIITETDGQVCWRAEKQKNSLADRTGSE